MSSDAWLHDLAPVERLKARRWLKGAGGEAAFARIASAYVAAQRPRGRPRVNRDHYVLEAAILWMTDLGLADFGAAAGAVVGKAMTSAPAEKRELPTPERLRRDIREKLETADKAFWLQAEAVAGRRGKLVRRGPFDEALPVWVREFLSAQRRLAVVNGRLEDFGHSTARNVVALLGAVDEMPISEAIRLLGDTADAWRAENPI